MRIASTPVLISAWVYWSGLADFRDVIQVTRGGCDWVAFESISDCLQARRFEDPASPQTPASNHAARIACLVHILQSGLRLDPVMLNVLPADPARHGARRRFSLWFEDGSHRFRAYEYLGLRRPLHVLLRGQPDVLDGALALTAGAFFA